MRGPVLGWMLVLLIGCAEGSSTVTGAADATLDGADACPEGCAIGERVCATPFAFADCLDDGAGCGIAGDPIACGLSEACEEGACVPVEEACQDGDGDGYGEGCEAGPDCKDDDRDVNPGVEEVCGDETDNNCAGGVDEGCGAVCSGQACVVGETRCASESEVETCVPDAQGCGVFGPSGPCAEGACEGGACQICVDGDGDGHGEGCVAGPDCDDGDASRYDGATEICDGEDNDCDREPDEGFDTLGQACTRGQGECQTQGVWVCDASDRTRTRCDAPNPPSGSREICDGADNDCDGAPDSGGVCTQCIDDESEENDTSPQGTPLTSARTYDEQVLCGQGPPGDVDWYDLGTWSSGFQAQIEMTQLVGTNGVGEGYANLDIDFWCASKFCEAVTGTQATTSLSFPTRTCYAGACAAGEPVRMRVYMQPSSTGPRSGTPYSMTRQ